MTSICAGCNEPIEGRVITALEKTWHPDHFICAECKKPITSSFKTQDDKTYCGKCDEKLFLNKCGKCNEYVRGQVITALGKHWHPEHFVCLECNKPITEKNFKEVNNKGCCNPCYLEKHADHCMGCTKPIAGDSIVALKGKWHAECFRCYKCDKVIEEESFGVDAGKPKCSKC